MDKGEYELHRIVNKQRRGEELTPEEQDMRTSIGMEAIAKLIIYLLSFGFAIAIFVYLYYWIFNLIDKIF